MFRTQLLHSVSATCSLPGVPRRSLYVPTKDMPGAGKSRGFSMLEMMIVCAISITIVAFAMPTFMNAVYSIRLKSAAHDLSGFMQRARVLAAKNNAVYTVGYQTVTGAQEAYVDYNNNGAWDPGEPILTFSSSISPAPAAPTGGGGTPTPYVLVGDTGTTVYDNTTTLGYSARGLPCAYVQATSTCATPAGGYFVYYLKDQRSNGTGWAAVVVTRSGRTKAVVWSGTAWQ